MKISGFTYIRNGVKLDYPYIESIRSILPICDEVVVVVGNSEDGTRDKIEEISSPKIRIIDTVWDDNFREGGQIFAQQTDIGLDNIEGDWGLYIQADEIYHENEIGDVKRVMEKYHDDPEVEGLLFPYIHFWGYDHIRKGRSSRRYEIRAVRNDPLIRSYLDSQGFRIYLSKESYENGHEGNKIKVRKTTCHIYHYSKVRDPKLEIEKAKTMAKFWHDDQWVEDRYGDKDEWDYGRIDQYTSFPKEGHPAVMKKRAESSSWTFDEKKVKFHFKFWFLNLFEKITGWRVGEYKNYKLIK